MSFQVSARKYRPQNFDEVFGQSHITDTLKVALANDKLAHAYLFTGPRGVGKTTCARILAKVINCENVTNGQACGECNTCTSFQSNASFNIIEIDAASNNSVDGIRQLTDTVRYQPQQGKYKVYIIDEVHMLSQQAFNAFLKTLEEPPPYAIFILATTEKHKILPTILSRCQTFDFKRIQIKDMIEQLQTIAKEEGIATEPEALYAISEKADGAMRDALSIFDRISGSADKHISYQDVVEKLNILDYDYFFKVTDAVIREDHSDMLLVFNDVLKNGFEGDHFLNGLAEHFRQLLLSQEPKMSALVDLSDKLKVRYHHQASSIHPSHILTALNLLNEADFQYPRAKNKRLHVEIALLKLCYQGRERKAQGPPPIPTENLSKKKLDAPVADSANADQASITSSPRVSPSSSPPPPPPSIPNKKVEVAKSPSPQEEKETSLGSAESAKVLVSSHKPKINTKVIDKSIPGTVNIDSMLADLRKDNAEEKAQSVEISEEAIRKTWDHYILEKVDSPSTTTMLNRIKMTLKDKVLHIDVPTQLNKETVLHEVALIQHIRESFRIPDLSVNVTVDASLFPDVEISKPKKLLSKEEKFALIKESNPLVVDLVKKLDLKFDDY